VSIADLVAAKKAAEAALDLAQLDLAGRYDMALAAYRDRPGDETKSAYTSAAGELAACRAALKAGRPGVSVGGDVTTGTEG
jgi:hypothetical protein